jgi:hypothetical protein
MTRGASYGEKMTPEFPLILLGLSFVSSGAKRSGVEGPAFVFLLLCRNPIVPDQ